MNEQIQMIGLDEIEPHPGNRRIGGFNQEKLEQLAESIRAVGVQQPAVIRKKQSENGEPGKYELVAGERRWRAARLAGLKTLPCVLRILDDIEVLKIQTIENLQREDIHPLDEADGYARLREKAGYDVELISKEVGRSASYVYQRLKLLDLVPEARKALVAGEISAGHAILIARLQPAQQKQALEFCTPDPRYGREVSVRDLDGWIHNEILMDLAGASFKKDDPDLVEASGPCTLCPKHTGFQPALFPEIGKKDYCLDPDCFAGKLDAMVEKQRRELKEKKEPIMEAAGRGYYQQTPKGALEPYGWDECRKKDPEAKRVLIVTGSDRGRLTWGKKRESYRTEKTPEEKAQEKKKKAEQKLKMRIRKRLFDEVVAAISESNGNLDDRVIRLIVRQHYSHLWNDIQKKICQIEGWESPPLKEGQNTWERPGWCEIGIDKIEEMEASELQIFLVKCSLVQYLDGPVFDSSEGGERDDLIFAAELYGVDRDAIESEMRKER